MNFFRIILISLSLLSTTVYADNHDKETVDNVISLDDSIPLNDPFAGNESSGITNLTGSESTEALELINFKLTGVIAGKEIAYVALTSQSGEVINLTIDQYLGKIKLVDMRINEAIFEKENGTFIILDFNNQIREANEY
jgi:hypothetical protein